MPHSRVQTRPTSCVVVKPCVNHVCGFGWAGLDRRERSFLSMTRRHADRRSIRAARGDGISPVRDVWLAMLAQCGKLLRHAPPHVYCQALFENAVRNFGNALASVPASERSAELVLLALNQNGHALEFVPNEGRTEAMLLAAVRKDGSALMHIPRSKRTKTLCMLAMQDPLANFALVPAATRDKELCLEAVRCSGKRISMVPRSVLDTEICQAAVEVTYDIPFGDVIPPHAWTKQMAIVALQMGTVWSLVRFPERLRRDRDVCEVAVMLGAFNLAHVADDLLDLEMCLAGRNHGRALLEHVPARLRRQVEAELRWQ